VLARRARCGSRLAALGSWRPSGAFLRGGRCCRRSARVGSVLEPPRLERCQTCEEGVHPQSHMERGLLPSGRREAETRGKGGGSQPVAHEALSSCLVRASLPPNRCCVSRTVPGVGSSTCCRPRDQLLVMSLGLMSESTARVILSEMAKYNAPPPTKGSKYVLNFSGSRGRMACIRLRFPPTHLTKGFEIVSSCMLCMFNGLYAYEYAIRTPPCV
jgi:hypothetical protein